MRLGWLSMPSAGVLRHCITAFQASLPSHRDVFAEVLYDFDHRLGLPMSFWGSWQGGAWIPILQQISRTQSKRIWFHYLRWPHLPGQMSVWSLTRLSNDRLTGKSLPLCWKRSRLTLCQGCIGNLWDIIVSLCCSIGCTLQIVHMLT